MSEEVYVRPFVATGALLKAIEPGANGEWHIAGPLAPRRDDYDGEILTKAGVLSGLDTYGGVDASGRPYGFGGHVDYGHMYVKSGKQPKYLIGRKHSVQDGPDGMPWMDSKLFKSKEYAQQLWEHLGVGGTAGYSVQGLCKLRNPADKRQIIKTEIHLVTADPQPKGFGNHLIMGGIPTAHASTLGEVVKALADEATAGEISQWAEWPEASWDDESGLWLWKGFLDKGQTGLLYDDLIELLQEHGLDRRASEQIAKSLGERRMGGGQRRTVATDGRLETAPSAQELTATDAGSDAQEPTGDRCPQCGTALDKALTAGQGIVGDGATGGAALKRQEMVSPSGAQKQRPCPVCKCRNRADRQTCRNCGADLTGKAPVGMMEKASQFYTAALAGLRGYGAEDPVRLAISAARQRHPQAFGSAGTG